MAGGKGSQYGTPQGGVISPLLANLYMNRFLKHWRRTGRGETYRALAPDCARLLASDGCVALEIGQGQSDAVAGLLAREGLEVIERRRDLAGIERCLVARRAVSGRCKQSGCPPA